MAAEPVSVRTLARLLGGDRRFVERSLEELEAALEGRGVRLQRNSGQVQLVTAPENAAVVREFLRVSRPTRLSRAALETLAVICYRQPVTRAEIEGLRGVGVERVLVHLLARGLVEEVGRGPGAGRPIQYGTTFAFLEAFGLRSPADLPEAEEEPDLQTSPALLGFNAGNGHT